MYSDVNFAFGKPIGFRVGTNKAEAMLRRILQMVSVWFNKVSRIAFVGLNRAVFLGRHRPILVYFHGGDARFTKQRVVGGRGFCV